MNLREIDIYCNSLKGIKKIQSLFKCNNIFTENKKVKIFFENKAIFVDNKSDIEKKFRHYKFPFLAISYNFGIIFSKKIINLYKYGIWNIHAGYLPKYRGRHPITAAFLKDEKKIGLSLHSINEKKKGNEIGLKLFKDQKFAGVTSKTVGIDQGYLLSERFVKRTYKDDENTIHEKFLSKIIPLLRSGLKNFKKNKIKKIKKGSYYKPFFKGIKIDNPESADYKLIYNIIKAQKIRGGLLIKNRVVKDVLFYSRKNLKKNSSILICKKGKKLILQHNLKYIQDQNLKI